MTWKTLLDVLGHFETKHTVDELMTKIVSVLGGGYQVSVCVCECVCCVLCAVWRRQVLVSCDVYLCLYYLLLSQVVVVSGPFRPVSSSASVVSEGAVSYCKEESTHL